MTTTYRDCPVQGCDGEWAFDLVESEGPDYSVGLMGYTFIFALDRKYSCEHADDLTNEELTKIEEQVGYDYAKNYQGEEDVW
jgi:hypothetical protein